MQNISLQINWFQLKIKHALQGPKLLLPGRQCDWKFCTGDQNFSTGGQWATSYFATIGISHHCKIYINLDFQPKQLQIKFRSSSQQLNFYLDAASAIKWKGISISIVTAYNRSEPHRNFSAVSHFICVAGSQADHVLPFVMSIYSGDVVFADVLQSFCNLL